MLENETIPSMHALTGRAKEALGCWNLDGQIPQLLKVRENAVFRILLENGEPAALRLHRQGYHDEKTLASELAWMAVLRQENLPVPAPVVSQNGQLIVALPATSDFGVQYADIVSWMHGSPLGQSGISFPHSRERLAIIFRSLGETMARMHTASDTWQPAASFSRPSWDANGFLGNRPLWGRFWDCEGLSKDQAHRLDGLRQSLQAQIAILPALDYGLIHADLVRENVLVDGDRIQMIDFDDGGYGWRMFDIATALFKNRQEPHYAIIEAALIQGYRAVRPLPDSALATLPLFMVLRSVTYIGWIGERFTMPDAADRLRRYVTDALNLAEVLSSGVAAG